MSHQVFISYASKDRELADAARAALEASGVECWIADKDIKPTESYAAAIIRAIEASRLILLVFTANANASRHVAREIEAADRQEIPVLTFRAEELAPTGALKFFLSSTQWFDALPPPPRQHLKRLAREIKKLLGMSNNTPTAPSGLKAAQVIHESVGVEWERNGDGARGFRVERRDESRHEDGFRKVVLLDADTTKYTDDGVSYGHTYTYRVCAFNEAGDSDYSNEAEVTVKVETTASSGNALADWWKDSSLTSPF